jgi:hypothetical protein
MSLRTLLTLMALVSSLMIGAVVYRKVLTPEVVTYGERRSLDRICGDRCANQAGNLAEKPRTTDEMAAIAHACMDRCVQDALAAHGAPR